MVTYSVQSISQMVKVAGFQLTPFIKCVIIYFVVYSFGFWNSNLISTLLKCAPIVCLMAFIFMTDFRFNSSYRYHQLILCGLIFSCCGDALLDYKDKSLFVFGMGAFAVAQVFYITAFGLKPLRLPIGIIVYIVGGASLALIFTKITGILLYGIPVYSLLLLTMAWRSIARIDKFSAPQIFCGIGGVFFAISDTLIALSMFYIDIPYSQILIMSTYYFAQFGITVSILDIVNKNQKSN